jgi:hypothetical protein
VLKQLQEFTSEKHAIVRGKSKGVAVSALITGAHRLPARRRGPTDASAVSAGHRPAHRCSCACCKRGSRRGATWCTAGAGPPGRLHVPCCDAARPCACASVRRRAAQHSWLQSLRRCAVTHAYIAAPRQCRHLHGMAAASVAGGVPHRTPRLETLSVGQRKLRSRGRCNRVASRHCRA